MYTANADNLRPSFGTFSLRCLFATVGAFALLEWVARFGFIYVAICGGLTGSIVGTFIAFSRYANSEFGFSTTLFGGACGAFISTMAVVFATITFSLTKSFVTDSWPNPEEQYVTAMEAFALVTLFYGGGSLFGGACAGSLGWLVLRGYGLGGQHGVAAGQVTDSSSDPEDLVN